jgi:hypothetical protein
MPLWVESVLAVLGDPRLISLVALGLSLWSLMRTRSLTSLQTQLAAFQLKDRERIEAARTKGDIRVRLFGAGSSHRIELSNQVGAGPASDVDIEFLDQEEDSLLPQGERKDNLPVPRLEPGESITLMVVLAMGRWPPFKIALSWKDPDGTPQRREAILYRP